MTIFTDRELERVASLRVNWRTEFRREVARLGHERHFAKDRSRLPSAGAVNFSIFRRSQPYKSGACKVSASEQITPLVV